MTDLLTRALGGIDYSRNFANAKPNIGPTEKEHILGLCKLVEELCDEMDKLAGRGNTFDGRNGNGYQPLATGAQPALPPRYPSGQSPIHRDDAEPTAGEEK